MSELLDEIIAMRKAQTLEYEKYLQKIVELSRKISGRETGTSYPDAIKSSAQKALYDNLRQDVELAVALDEGIRYIRKDAWRDNKFKTKEVRLMVEDILEQKGIVTPDEIDAIFEVIKNQKEY